MAVVEAPSVPQHRDVEDVLRAGGLSAFHRRAVLITGAAWTFVAMEILLVGFTLPIFIALWNLDGRWAGFVGSAALAGSLVGSLVLGRVADRVGRRRIFLASILWYSLFTALTALAWGPWSILALRFLAGLGLGGMLVVDPALLAEYVPPQRRGRLLVFLDFFWPVGLLLAVCLSYVFLDVLGGEWRWLYVAAAFPAFLAFAARLRLPESPYWLARRGRREEAADVLEQITGERPAPETIDVAPQPRGSIRELFAPALRRTSLLVIGVWAALNISYYGLFLWLPFVLLERDLTLNVYVLLSRTAVCPGSSSRRRTRGRCSWRRCSSSPSSTSAPGGPSIRTPRSSSRRGSGPAPSGWPRASARRSRSGGRTSSATSRTPRATPSGRSSSSRR